MATVTAIAIVWALPVAAAVLLIIAVVLVLQERWHRRALELSESEASEAVARITDKLSEPGGDGYAVLKVSFCFEAAHTDDEQYLVRVTDRLVSKDLWGRIVQGGEELVMYLPEEPRCCRLAKAAPPRAKDSDGKGGKSKVSYILAGAGVVLLVGSLVCAGLLVDLLNMAIAVSVFLGALAIFAVLAWTAGGFRHFPDAEAALHDPGLLSGDDSRVAAMRQATTGEDNADDSGADDEESIGRCGF
eukprot:gnl/TRDRNA2_/TRDRNA2_187602_c0_seq1.p1 gnl/TRDRNA2_/TRDRNA2_187602_c0~~gnl/TRDRNA2_/TRDRNA2_187602_c0_seq1.p1  ORF type:complete len:269 (+),score=55.41 gnl/TRDRNA2_/TRDRNA2_187602_c0_seq1:74-808(+)